MWVIGRTYFIGHAPVDEYQTKKKGEECDQIKGLYESKEGCAGSITSATALCYMLRGCLAAACSAVVLIAAAHWVASFK